MNPRLPLQSPAFAGLEQLLMRRALLRVHLHLVWSTWDRLPMLTDAIRSKVHAAIAAKARELGCKDVHVGGVPDHVHVLVDLPAVVAVADLVRHMKGSSSHLVNADLAPGGTFRWQGSYGALSVSPGGLERARRYVAKQEEHHCANELEPEFELTEDNQEKPEPREGGALQV